MSMQIVTQDERRQAEEKKCLALLLRRQIALQKDGLMSDASSLVDEHFKKIDKGNRLKAAQLKNLEGVAFSSLNASDVFSFLNNQAKKDRDKKPERQGWIHNKLDEHLRNNINQIIGRNSKRKTGELGRKDEIIAEVKNKAEDLLPISQDVLDSWFSEEREQDIQMELLREFVSHFSIFYDLKAKEILGQADEEA